MNYKKLFKSKIFVFLFTFAIELGIFLIFSTPIHGHTYIFPDISLSLVFGLMFGPVGACGVSLAAFIGDLYTGSTLIASLSDFMILFIISCISFKLWYTIMGKKGFQTPKFDSSYNVIKFFMIILLAGVIYFTLFGLNVLYLFDVSLKYALEYFLNFIDFSILFGLSFLLIFNKLEIPLYQPKLIFKRNISSKIYDILLIIALCLGIFIFLT